MRQIPRAPGSERIADDLAAEFLRAQEVAVPASIEELRQASESASAEVESLLVRYDHLRAMKDDGEDDRGAFQELPVYDAWIEASLDLDEVFLEEHGGTLGKRLMEFAAMDDADFLAHAPEAQELLRRTSNVALRMYSVIHRFVTLGFASSRSEVVEKLSVGELTTLQRVHGVSLTPRRRTIIGLLRDVDARLPADMQTDLWLLEAAPEFPTVAALSDPFRTGDDSVATYWRQRIAAHHDVRPGEQATILSLSSERTSAVMWELEHIADHATDDVLKGAAQTIAHWLDEKRIYYQDPDPRDFELYHLGMERPETLMSLFRSLDVMKHIDPELFFELLGIHATEGGRSAYFGSFLHKALFNTQRVIESAPPELGTMAIGTMMRQLLTVDDRVQTYAAVVSQESLKAMAGEVKKSVDAAETSTSKAQTLMMLAVPYSRMAIDAEVRRQLDALREASPENVVEELRRRVADIEHPLKLAEYIGLLPKAALQDVRVLKEIRNVFGDIQIDAVQEQCLKRRPEYIKVLYDRIPLIDESRDDLGFALRIKVALRDGVVMTSFAEQIAQQHYAIPGTTPNDFLRVILRHYPYREDYDAIKDTMSFWERRIAERFRYASRGRTLTYSGIMQTRMDECGTDADRSFFVGQMFIVAANQDLAGDFFTLTPFHDRERYRPDLVFLSIVAHPQGKEVAFKYFDKFCDLIPAERMCEMLRLLRPDVLQFSMRFEGGGDNNTKAYLDYLRKQLPNLEPLFIQMHDRLELYKLQPEHIEYLRKMNRALVEKKTPWIKFVSIFSGEEYQGVARRVAIDAWELWGFLGRQSLNPQQIADHDARAWDGIDTMATYSLPELSRKLMVYMQRYGDAESGAIEKRIHEYLSKKLNA
jgi:hypothetical protein